MRAAPGCIARLSEGVPAASGAAGTILLTPTRWFSRRMPCRRVGDSLPMRQRQSIARTADRLRREEARLRAMALRYAA